MKAFFREWILAILLLLSTPCVVAAQSSNSPSISSEPTNQTVLLGGTASFSVVVGGTEPFSYQWQFNGTNLPNNIITTVAGKAAYGFSGDGGLATNAELYYPSGVTPDGVGDLFIADFNNNRVRKVDTNGIITTVAGSTSGGYGGDGGLATSARLNGPYGLAFDAYGNFFIADQNNNRIRRVDTNGIITTVAGSFPGSYSGDGGAATNALLFHPSGVAFDVYGNLFIADENNNRIRKINTNGIITTVAGKNGAGYGGDGFAATNALLNFPSGVAFDGLGNLYIADSGNNRIRMTTTNSIIFTVAGTSSSGFGGDGGLATNGNLNDPINIGLDTSGNLYIADHNNERIRMVNSNGIITTVAGNGIQSPAGGDGGIATNASIYTPEGVALDGSGNLYIADSYSRIREVHFGGYPALTLTNVGLGNLGNYSVVVSSQYGSVTSTAAALDMPPFITSQPGSQTAVVGSSPSFSVQAGGPGPFDFEWYWAGTNLFESGTNSTLTLANVSTNDAGNYTVVITNNYGSVTSQVAILTVVLPPSVVIQPVNQTNGLGSSVTFKVTAGGTGPFSYQWQLNGTNFPNNIITTLAGNGSGSFGGDGGAATNGLLSLPEGVACDALGDVYIADYANSRIRKVDTNGIITTVAGNGTFGYFGDGGAATNAILSSPDSVALDAYGNVFIADRNNNRIRKLSTNGIITSVAGNGYSSYYGDGGAATNASLSTPAGITFDDSGNLYIADSGNLRVRRVATNGIITTLAGGGNGGDGGVATNASLVPTGVSLDTSGNLYIADNGNNRIRKVDTKGIITTVAGNGGETFSGDGGAATNASLYYPNDVALDVFGNLYIADKQNDRIRKVDTNGIIITVAGIGNNDPFLLGDGFPATNASLYFPAGVASDGSGNLYIADTYNNRVRKVDFGGYPTLTLNYVTTANAGSYSVVITSQYGSVTSSPAAFDLLPFITTQPSSEQAVVGTSPAFSVQAGGSQPLEYAWYFSGTNLLQSGANNTLTLSDVSTNNSGNYTVVITNSFGSITSQIATLSVGFPPTIATQPASETNVAGSALIFNVTGVGIGPFTYQWRFNGTNLPINIITTMAGNGADVHSGDGGVATNASLYSPFDMAFDANGNQYIADTSNNCIRKVDINGIITTVAGNGTKGFSGDGGAATNASLYFPRSVGFDPAGNLYFTDSSNGRIRRVDANGVITTVAGTGNSGYSGDGGAATNANLDYPSGLTFDLSANLFIADAGNNRIRRVDTNGFITTVAGNGNGYYAGDGGLATNASLFHPSTVALDSFGNLFIADSFNSRIRMVNAAGIISTVAGNNIYGGYSGDGGAATNANLSAPYCVVCDSFGNLYISDSYNNRIRMVNTDGTITTVAGNGSGGYSGDGGASTNASLYSPAGVALDGSGNLYIADAYNNRIRKVDFGGYPTLTLNNVTAANTGNYSVVVSSPYGSVTSVLASLTITIPTTPPQILAGGTGFGFTTSQSGFGFNLDGTFDQTIVVDGSTDLVNWIPLFTNVVVTNQFYFLDPAATSFPARFYRARLQ